VGRRALLKHPAFATDEFPRIARPDGETEELLALDGELLHEIVGQICFAAATDDSRPVLTAIHLELCAGQATFAAADAFRLATRTLPVPDSQRRGSWLIPARTLICLGRLLPAESSVQFLLAGQQILFHTPYLDLSSPLLAGTYPDIRQVIPTESLTRLVIQTRELAGAVRLMQSFGQSLAQLSFEQHAGQELTLSVTAPEVGTTDVHLMGVLTGHTQRLSLSLAHLGEALAAVSTSQVQIALTSERQPMLLTPVGSVQTVQVLMPRQLPPKAASAAATAAAGLGSAH
jgi:DNA polymerase-3 subunit beta